MVSISAPYFEFDHRLLSKVINNHIRAFHISCARFDIIVSHAIDDWAEIEQKIPSPILFIKSMCLISIQIIKMNHKFFQYQTHI